MEQFLSFLPTVIMVILVLFSLLLVGLSIFFVPQGQVAVITRFGKYLRSANTGLNFKIPFIDQIFKSVSLQNQTVTLKFQAITSDQANVYFNAMLLYATKDSEEETIKIVAFKFANEEAFSSALSRTIEGAVRAYVATQKQSDVLRIRKELVDHVKSELDNTLSSWGYHLQDLQINDITFDKAIMDSMSQVVASSNLRAAAENEGQALLITKTKAAEAEGNAIKISAEAEKIAAQLRGQGVALFREEVAKGMSQAAEQMKAANMDVNVIMFSMWTEAIKNFAEYGKGNVIFLDGSPDGMQNTMKQMMAMSQNENNNKK